MRLLRVFKSLETFSIERFFALDEPYFRQVFKLGKLTLAPTPYEFWPGLNMNRPTILWKYLLIFNDN